MNDPHDHKFVIKYMCNKISFSRILTERASGYKKRTFYHIALLPFAYELFRNDVAEKSSIFETSSLLVTLCH